MNLLVVDNSIPAIKFWTRHGYGDGETYMKTNQRVNVSSHVMNELWLRTIEGKAKLPAEKGMLKHVRKVQKTMAGEFVASRRHTIQVYGSRHTKKLQSCILNARIEEIST